MHGFTEVALFATVHFCQSLIGGVNMAQIYGATSKVV